MNKIDLKNRVAIVTGAARGHVTDEVGRLRGARLGPASRPGSLRERRVGGARGFGLAITERFLDSGAAVSMWDMDGAELEVQARRLGPRGRIMTEVVNVTDEDHVAAAAKSTLQKSGRVDILVNNAGIMGPIRRSWEYSLAEWRKVMAVNVDGVYLCSRAVVPVMVGQKYGRIVNLASIAGKNGSPYFSPYATSKAAVIGLTKAMGKDLAKDGVIVNCITPAAADTNILDGVSADLVKSMVDQVPMGRFAAVEEIASMVAWMSSEDCSFTTGGARGHVTDEVGRLRGARLGPASRPGSLRERRVGGALDITGGRSVY